jgi:hypothetical protein
MINSIGDNTFRTAAKADPLLAVHDRQAVRQKTQAARQDRPIENADASGKARSQDAQGDETKYLLEDKTLVFEKYNKDGDLIMRVPPSHKPVDERV